MLRGFHCSESVVLFHSVYWMSFSFVLVLFGFGDLLLVFTCGRHPALCISPVVLQVRIVD